MQEKIEERTNFGPIVIGPFLLDLCHSNDVRSIIIKCYISQYYLIPNKILKAMLSTDTTCPKTRKY